jgi:hypothetical protein
VDINKLKPCRYLGKVLRGLRVIVKGGSIHKEALENKEDLEHKEDSPKKIWYGSTKNQTTQKTEVN